MRRVQEVCVTAALVFLCACTGRAIPPYLHLEAEFDTAKISAVENIVRNVARDWGLRVREKDKREMRFVSLGADAFFMSVYYENDTIVHVTNAGGVGASTLRLFASDYGKMPKAKLDDLISDLVRGIETYDIKFRKIPI